MSTGKKMLGVYGIREKNVLPILFGDLDYDQQDQIKNSINLLILL
jgi:hypothetical protein